MTSEKVVLFQLHIYNDEGKKIKDFQFVSSQEAKFFAKNNNIKKSNFKLEILILDKKPIKH